MGGQRTCYYSSNLLLLFAYSSVYMNIQIRMRCCRSPLLGAGNAISAAQLVDPPCPRPRKASAGADRTCVVGEATKACAGRQPSLLLPLLLQYNMLQARTMLPFDERFHGRRRRRTAVGGRCASLKEGDSPCIVFGTQPDMY